MKLSGLGREEFVRILVEPRNALTKQYSALLATEGVSLDFGQDAVEEVARISEEVNSRAENIGARWLQTVMEKVLDEISFDAPDRRGSRLKVDAAHVSERLQKVVEDEDLSRYVL